MSGQPRTDRSPTGQARSAFLARAWRHALPSPTSRPRPRRPRRPAARVGRLRHGLRPHREVGEEDRHQGGEEEGQDALRGFGHERRQRDQRDQPRRGSRPRRISTRAASSSPRWSTPATSVAIRLPLAAGTYYMSYHAYLLGGSGYSGCYLRRAVSAAQQRLLRRRRRHLQQPRVLRLRRRTACRGRDVGPLLLQLDELLDARRACSRSRSRWSLRRSTG